MSKKNQKQEAQDTQEKEVKQDAQATEEQGQETKDAEEGQENELQSKLDELNDKYLRLYSEFDNYKRRTVKERGDMIQYAGKEVIEALLPVLDDFERAMKSMEDAQSVEAVKEGVTLIHNKLYNVLKQKGLTPMESTGQEFDVDYHEALTKIPAPSDDLKGKVVDEVEKGYMLKDKVLRFAKVVVGE